SGLGLAVAGALHSKGWNLAIADLDSTKGTKLVTDFGPNTIFIKTDVTDYFSQVLAFKKTVQRFSGLDFVFANAGIAGRGGFYDVANEWPPKPPSLLLQDVCLTGVVYSCWLGMHYMRRNAVPGGSIVMTASAASLYPSPDLPLYCSSKHGVLGLMRSMSIPLARENIRVSCILPGAIHTSLHPEAVWAQFGKESFTSIDLIVKTVLELLDDDEAAGKAMEVSAGEVFNRKQPEFCNDMMRTIMTDKEY
ncbi:NAD(P)-binding protein, partial [Mytilinidion resinicola]